MEKGEVAAEANLNFSKDKNDPAQDNYLSQVYSLEYGVTGWWKTELGAEIEKETDSNMKLTNLKWENVFVPFKPGENWIDTGFYAELERGIGAGATNNAEFKLLLEKDIGKFSNLVNIGASHEFGQNHGQDWNGSLYARSGYRYSQYFEPGIEYYGDFGSMNHPVSFDQQSHVIGPVAWGKIDNVKYDAGALFGMSKDAPDATFKVNLEYEF